jgi:hypothetical protein
VNYFNSAGLAAISIIFIACGGTGSPQKKDDIVYPETGSVIAVEGRRLVGNAVVAREESDLRKFISNLEDAPDVCRNLVRSGRVLQIPNGTRVRIRLCMEMISRVEILDGDYAGEKGYMDSGECGAKNLKHEKLRISLEKKQQELREKSQKEKTDAESKANQASAQAKIDRAKRIAEAHREGEFIIGEQVRIVADCTCARELEIMKAVVKNSYYKIADTRKLAANQKAVVQKTEVDFVQIAIGETLFWVEKKAIVSDE